MSDSDYKVAMFLPAEEVERRFKALGLPGRVNEELLPRILDMRQGCDQGDPRGVVQFVALALTGYIDQEVFVPRLAMTILLDMPRIIRCLIDDQEIIDQSTPFVDDYLSHMRKHLFES